MTGSHTILLPRGVQDLSKRKQPQLARLLFRRRDTLRVACLSFLFQFAYAALAPPLRRRFARALIVL